MTGLFIRKILSEDENINDPGVRRRCGTAVGAAGLVCNAALFAVKLVIGTLSGSVAVTADAMNNLSDAASSVIGLAGARIAGKPADAKHPFGYGRMEYICALAVSFLIIEVGFTFLKSSVGKIISPDEVLFEWGLFAALIFSVLVKLWMANLNNKVGKMINSGVMKATAADSAMDAVTTAAAALSMLAGHLTSLNIDAYAGLAVSVIVMWSGISIAEKTLEPLMGQRTPAGLYREITALVESQNAILGTHDLIVHNYGPGQSMATIHAEISNDMSIEEAHTAADTAEREAFKKLGILLVVHIDPVETHDKEVLELKEKVNGFIKALDPTLTFHDFHVVKDEEGATVFFDLVVCESYKEEDCRRVMHQLMALIQQIPGGTKSVITLDRNFLSTPAPEEKADR